MLATVYPRYWTERLGKRVREEALRQCPKGYEIDTRISQEYNAIALVWNQDVKGFSRSVCKCRDSRRKFTIHPKELSTLVRWLFESGGEDAGNIAANICSDLGIELT